MFYNKYFYISNDCNQNIELQSQGTSLSSHSSAFTPTPSYTQRTYTDDGSDAKDAKNEDGTCPPMNNTSPPTIATLHHQVGYLVGSSEQSLMNGINARDETRLVSLAEANTTTSTTMDEEVAAGLEVEMNSMQEAAANVITAAAMINSQK